ncbi:hypothetical protein CEXT_390911 [Caerostris extrusa]|uniref:Uncharacterized protein n=1 Tax=Caerostris extrusa TaxID=172846 RepID=A0AAV4WFW5_CAEEX|nr:hypothetical protein CEXT_390911 [Caerostris extrusa]
MSEEPTVTLGRALLPHPVQKSHLIPPPQQMFAFRTSNKRLFGVALFDQKLDGCNTVVLLTVGCNKLEKKSRRYSLKIKIQS